jgi:hypothetical protein
MNANLAHIIVFSHANVMGAANNKDADEKRSERDSCIGDNASLMLQLGRDTPTSLAAGSRSLIDHSPSGNEPARCCPSTPPSKSSSADSEPLAMHSCAACDEDEPNMGKGKGKGKARGKVSEQSSSLGSSSTAESGPDAENSDTGKCCELANSPPEPVTCCSFLNVCTPVERKDSMFSCSEIVQQAIEQVAEEIVGATEETEYASAEQGDVPFEYSVETEPREALNQVSIAHDSMLADMDTPASYTQSLVGDSNVCTPGPNVPSPRRELLEKADEMAAPKTTPTSKVVSVDSEPVTGNRESPELTKHELKKRKKEKRSYDKAAKKVAKRQEKVDKAARRAGEPVDGAADDPSSVPSPSAFTVEQSFLTYHTADESFEISRQLDGHYSADVDIVGRGSHNDQPFERVHLTEQDVSTVYVLPRSRLNMLHRIEGFAGKQIESFL